MVNLICGSKGSGKTSRIIDKANADVKTAKGDCIFVNDTDRYMYDVDRNIKLIDVTEYPVAGEEALLAFVCGLAASRSDLTNLYIDGASRIAGCGPDKMKKFYDELGKLADKLSLSVTVTVSATAEELPDFLLRYKII